jgi:hypothetical protein
VEDELRGKAEIGQAQGQPITIMRRLEYEVRSNFSERTQFSSKAFEKHLVDSTEMIKSSLAPSKITLATLEHPEESRH